MAITSPIINLVAHPKMVLPKLFTFTRNSTGFYMTQQETLKVAQNNVPRLSFDNKSDEFLGLMLEGAAVNRLKNSNIPTRDFTGASWTKTNVTAAATYQGVRDSSDVSATSRLATSATTGASTGTITATVTGLTIGAAYTISVYVRRVSGTGAFKFIVNGSVQGTDKAATNTTEFYRYYTKFTANATTSVVGLSLPANSVFIFDYMQVEQNFLTSVVPGSGASNSRSSEALTISEDDAVEFIKPFAGTFYFSMMFNENVEKIANQSTSIAAIGNVNSPEFGNIYTTRITIGVSTGSTVADNKFTFTVSGDTATATQATKTDREIHKVAITYQTNGKIRVCVDGQTPVESSTTFTKCLSATSYGQTWLTLADINGGLLHFAYFGTAFGDADLISLTS